MRDKTAAVIGGSIAGLLAARALAPHFGKVVLFERDEIRGATEPRKGVPQGAHVHVLLAAGADAIERGFPGIFDAIAARGGLCFDMGEGNNWFHFGVWKRRMKLGIEVHIQSRLLLEELIRERTLALDNVELCTASVGEISWHGGVPRVATRADVRPFAFVVDASGRGSQMPKWLETAGYARPESESVSVDVTYTTARFRPQHDRDWRCVLIYPTPPREKRAGAVVPTETGEVLISLFGWCGENAAASDEAFLEFARRLPRPEIADLIATSERTSPLRQFHYKEARLNHYEKLSRFPPATIVLGDALCSVDPVFGQGMTVAALSADLLDECAKSCGGSVEGLARRFRRETARAYGTAWSLSTTEDLRYPEASGVRPLGTRFAHYYTRRVHELTATDADVALRFARVMHLLAEPKALFHPSVMWKVLRVPLAPTLKEAPRPTRSS
jgi:2-polyprenyl-6-methoxyphenol hydroxylase-like FAD-dependent oxidoreductase